MDFLDRLDPAAQRETLPALIAAADTAQVPPAVAPEVQFWRQQFEDMLEDATLPPGPIHEALDRYAREYEAIRASLPPGPDRTFRMNELLAQVRAQAGFIRPREAIERFRRGGDGDRIVALALLEAEPDDEAFDVVLDAIANSRSAFEQYHALRAMDRMLPLLNAQQRKELMRVLEEERRDVRGTEPWKDPARWSYLNHLHRKLLPEPGARKTAAVNLGRKVDAIIQELHLPIRPDAPIDAEGTRRADYALALPAGFVLIEVRYIGGADRNRRLRNAMNDLRQMIDESGAVKGILVVQDDAVPDRPQVRDPRIEVASPATLRATLLREARRRHRPER